MLVDGSIDGVFVGGPRLSWGGARLRARRILEEETCEEYPTRKLVHIASTLPYLPPNTASTLATHKHSPPKRRIKPILKGNAQESYTYCAMSNSLVLYLLPAQHLTCSTPCPCSKPFLSIASVFACGRGSMGIFRGCSLEKSQQPNSRKVET